MPQFWWVNHNQTARQEIDGQYLWSPKTERGGKRSEFYNNMRRATPGDLVLSYAGQHIRYVGRVTDFAFTAPKPEEFGLTGGYWDDEGWLLPVFWTRLDPPINPKAMFGELGPLLPTRYSPLNQDGGGSQKAYLANISPEAFATVVANADFDRMALVHGGANSLSFEIVTEQLDDVVERRIAADITLDATTRQAIIQARRGQGRFRANVEAIEPSCRLTGVTNPALLIASHIKPWRACSTAEERLDGANGLMLTPDADHLFDRGFITFDDHGGWRQSSRVDPDDLQRLGLGADALERFGVAEASAAWLRDGFKPAQRRYLDYHRSEVFVA